MRTIIACFILSGAFLIVGTIAVAADRTPVPPAATTNQNTLAAAGSVEDSLKACLARIPKDATAGQRLIAEQTCRRDEGDRQPFHATGGRK
jgi:hypothetical protein